jgi:hypothetical protein
VIGACVEEIEVSVELEDVGEDESGVEQGGLRMILAWKDELAADTSCNWSRQRAEGA